MSQKNAKKCHILFAWPLLCYVGLFCSKIFYLLNTNNKQQQLAKVNIFVKNVRKTWVNKMSYTEQAKNINEKFKRNLTSYGDEVINDKKDIKELINAILYFGQVAKFRCRSNSAYDSFAKECFADKAL
jgi:hypothetical protein